jgi:hypothetical protein
VASELCKRRYEVAFTLGHNAPLADIMAISPETHTQFLIDVKGLAAKNYWQITRKAPRDNLFYLLVLVPREGANTLFIMPQVKVNEGITAEFGRLKPSRQQLGERANRLGLRWRDAEDYVNCWDLLPK